MLTRLQHIKSLLYALVLLVTLSFPLKAETAKEYTAGLHHTGAWRGLYLCKGSAVVGQDAFSLFSESTVIHLYRGFAVIKSKYRVRNLSMNPHSLILGIPNTGKFTRKDVPEVTFDSLRSFRVRVNRKFVDVDFDEYPDKEIEVDKNVELRGWYRWVLDFQPEEIKYVEVMYTIITNDAIMTQGYDNEYICGMSFLFAPDTHQWAESRSMGRFLVRMMDDLDVDDINGILPGSSFMTDDDRVLVLNYDKEFLQQCPSMLLSYYSWKDSFKEAKVKYRIEEAYEQIKTDEAFSVKTDNFEAFTAQDFGVFNRMSGIVLFIIVLPILVLVIAGYFFYKNITSFERTKPLK